MPFASALSFSAMMVPTVLRFGSLACALAVVIIISHFRVRVMSSDRNKLSTSITQISPDYQARLSPDCRVAVAQDCPALPPALPAVAQSACECRRPRRRGCLPRSSRNCFAAASISMQLFHQPRFIRKTLCQRLIERCQTWWRKAKG